MKSSSNINQNYLKDLWILQVSFTRATIWLGLLKFRSGMTMQAKISIKKKKKKNLGLINK